MKSATISKVGTGTHKPLVTGSIPVAATISFASMCPASAEPVHWIGKIAQDRYTGGQLRRALIGRIFRFFVCGDVSVCQL